MAEGETLGNGDTQDHKLMKRRFMELFHGRFNSEEADLLLHHNNWDLSLTANFVLISEPQEVSQILNEKEQEREWQEVRPRNRRQRREEALRNENLRGLAAQNNVPAEVRQFACENCDSTWWRKVPARKMVSKCFRCRRRFDCLPRELEWGWAKFVCQCNYSFQVKYQNCRYEGPVFMIYGMSNGTPVHIGFGAMGQTLCLCYRCRLPVWPQSIIPPKQRREMEGFRERRGRGRTDLHSCLGINCYNKTPFIPPLGFNPDDLICVHPKSLDKVVVEESEVHQSTGSTVDTFLTQGDLDTHDPLGVYTKREPSILEVDEDWQ